MDVSISAADSAGRAASGLATIEPSSAQPEQEPIGAPLREFLVWVARRPRTYAEAMEAWRSHCPRFTVWEDALAAKLIRCEPAPGQHFGEAPVTLTGEGRAALAAGETARR